MNSECSKIGSYQKFYKQYSVFVQVKFISVSLTSRDRLTHMFDIFLMNKATKIVTLIIVNFLPSIFRPFNVIFMEGSSGQNFAHLLADSSETRCSRVLHLMLFSIRELSKNRRRGVRAFLTGLN